MEARECLVMEIEKAYERLGTWRAVGEAFGVSPALAWRMVRQGYAPVDEAICARLGLPTRAQVTVVGGTVAAGAQVLGSQACERCGRAFVSNHPRRRRCFGCSPVRRKFK